MNLYHLVSLRSCVVACFVFAASAASAQLWNFDTDAQGWRLNDITGSGDYTSSQGVFPLDWHAFGGGPGGYVSHEDVSGFTIMFEAPTAQLGNYSSFLGGKLKFSLQTDQVPDYSADSVIVFRSGVSNLTIVSAIAPQPNTTWTDYAIDLTAGSFRYGNLGGAVVSEADFSTVLGDLNTFLIDAEYHNGVAEVTGLDSVAFVAASSAVPEPSTYGLLAGAALLGACVLRRYRRN
jgi:hypothetical protein